MRQVVVSLAGTARLVEVAGVGVARVCWRDQPQLAAQNCQQCVEFAWPARVARFLEQLAVRPHVPLDVGGALGKKRLKHAPGGRQMQPMLRIRGGTRERVFEERASDSFQPAHLLQGRRRPRLVLDHLRQQGKTNRGDLSILGQLVDCLIEEPVVPGLILAEAIVGQAEFPQDPPHMPGVERFDGREVVAFDKPNFQRAHEASGRHREFVANRHETLDVESIALAQSGHQLAVAGERIMLGQQPLLELVEHDQDLLAGAQQGSRPDAGDDLGEALAGGFSGDCTVQSSDQPRLGRSGAAST